MEGWSWYSVRFCTDFFIPEGEGVSGILALNKLVKKEEKANGNEIHIQTKNMASFVHYVTVDSAVRISDVLINTLLSFT